MASNDDDQINPEDVVQLNSGGPDMTVTGVGSENGVRSVWCTWLEGAKPKNAIFALSSLKHASQRL